MKKIVCLTQVLLITFMTTLAAQSDLAGPNVASLIANGDSKIKEITEENCRSAIADYEAALEIDPANYEANWKTARAYCWILDLKTHQLIVEKEEYKPALKELGEKAEAHGEKAYAANPKGLDGIVWYSGGYAYHAASMGILTAILRGSSIKVKKLANEAIAIDDTYHGAFGYRILGRLNIKAPFPVGNKKKAVEYLEKAVSKDPLELQNHYWLAEAYTIQKRYPEAKEQFRYVLNHPPKDIEVHTASSFKASAQDRLTQLEK